MFRSTDLTGLPAFAEYVRTISDGFCPFIEPSQLRQVLFFSEYHLEELGDKLEAAMFYLGLQHTEILRQERKKQTNRIVHDFLCENLIFYFPPQRDDDGKKIFSWPHWLLKVLYTKQGIVFGKFWKGEESTSKDGRPIPPPPNHFLSIRSAIKPTDIRFFSKAPQLTEEHKQSCDDGSDVFPEGLKGLDLAQMLQTDVYESMKATERKKL
jgi:hypothetical protein